MERPGERGVSRAVLWLVGGSLSLAALCVTAILVQDRLEREGFEGADRAFASRKADQMYNELQSAVNHDLDQGVSVLARNLIGTGYSPVLTANKAVTNPGDPLSGNLQVEGRWLYLRRFTFSNVEGKPLAQDVVVKVFRCAPGPDPLAPGVLLAVRTGTLVPQPGPPATPTPIGEPSTGLMVIHYPGESTQASPIPRTPFKQKTTAYPTPVPPKAQNPVTKRSK